MYRVLLTRGKKGYAIECLCEFDMYSKYYDNMFDENIRQFMRDGDVIVLLEDIEDFERYFPDYELETVERE